MTTKEKPQPGDVWQHVNGYEAYVVDPGGFLTGDVYFTTRGRSKITFVTDGSALTRLLYRPRCVRLEQATQAALLECAKIAVAPFAPQDNLTPEQCVDAVRKLRESCNAYVNKAGELLATRSRQVESQAATIRCLQATHTDQSEELKRADVRRADLQTRLDSAEKRASDANDRANELDNMVGALHSQIRNLCEAHKISFHVGESYQTALGRIGLALLEARRPSNVQDVPRGVAPVVELTRAEKDSIMDRVFAWQKSVPGAKALACANALCDHVAELCAKRAVSQPAPCAETLKHAVAKLNELRIMNENNALNCFG
jgi:hypothetical protein